MLCIVSRTNYLRSVCCLVCGVLAPLKLLLIPKAIVTDPLPNICGIVGGVFLCHCYLDLVRL